LGGPGETLDSIQETIDISTQFCLLFAHYYPLELYPGTPIYEDVFGNDKKKWFDIIMNDTSPWGDVVYENNHILRPQLMNLVYSAYSQFYGRSEWKELAKYHLNKNYNNILMAVESWQIDRFRLGQVDSV
jgi:radical SAM superfamily enzyme YgiQ (UPF0313 family)